MVDGFCKVISKIKNKHFQKDSTIKSIDTKRMHLGSKGTFGYKYEVGDQKVSEK